MAVELFMNEIASVWFSSAGDAEVDELNEAYDRLAIWLGDLIRPNVESVALQIIETSKNHPRRFSDGPIEYPLLSTPFRYSFASSRVGDDENCLIHSLLIDWQIMSNMLPHAINSAEEHIGHSLHFDIVIAPAEIGSVIKLILCVR